MFIWIDFLNLITSMPVTFLFSLESELCQLQQHDFLSDFLEALSIFLSKHISGIIFLGKPTLLNDCSSKFSESSRDSINNSVFFHNLVNKIS